MGYTPQVIVQESPASGAQRFQRSLSYAWQKQPNVLVLDEPTNHLDLDARQSLFNMLRRFSGTLLVGTHDEELLGGCVDIVWSIERKKIDVFSGSYEAFCHQRGLRLIENRERYQAMVKAQKKIHHDRMKIQERLASRRKYKKNVREKDRALRHAMKERAQKTSAGHANALNGQLEQTKESFTQFEHWYPSNPTFSLSTSWTNNGIVVAVSGGRVGYTSGDWLLSSIRFSIQAKEKMWLQGKNGSGKTTLIKGLLGDPDVVREGTWDIPDLMCIGYIDQHYATLDDQMSVFEHIKRAMPVGRSDEEVRRLLGHFLFRMRTEHHLLAQYLSGGEKLRLSLAQIAARSTGLLILDEVTNNVDLKTKRHLLQVLQHYEGAMVVISHDEAFAKALGITKRVRIEKKRLTML